MARVRSTVQQLYSINPNHVIYAGMAAGIIFAPDLIDVTFDLARDYIQSPDGDQLLTQIQNIIRHGGGFIDDPRPITYFAGWVEGTILATGVEGANRAAGTLRHILDPNDEFSPLDNPIKRVAAIAGITMVIGMLDTELASHAMAQLMEFMPEQYGIVMEAMAEQLVNVSPDIA